MKTFTTIDVMNDFDVVLESLCDSPVRINRDGLPVAIVLSCSQFEEMEAEHAMAKAIVDLITGDPVVVDTLGRYSEAMISSNDAVTLLGLKSQSQLLDLFGMTSLPFPSLPEDQIDAMVSRVLQAGEKLD